MMNGECVVNSFRHDFVVPPPSKREALCIYSSKPINCAAKKHSFLPEQSQQRKSFSKTD